MNGIDLSLVMVLSSIGDDLEEESIDDLRCVSVRADLVAAGLLDCTLDSEMGGAGKSLPISSCASLRASRHAVACLSGLSVRAFNLTCKSFGDW